MELVDLYEPKIRNTALHLYGRSFRDVDELHSLINAGIMHAIKLYNPEKGTRFDTYALQRIWSKVKDYRRDLMGSRRTHHIGQHVLPEGTIIKDGFGKENKAVKHRIVLSMHDGPPGGDHTYVGSIPSGAPNPAKLAEDKDLCVKLLKGLSDYERRIMTMYFFDRLTFKEIGVVLELSESRICQVFQVAVKVIRDKMGVTITDTAAMYHTNRRNSKHPNKGRGQHAQRA